MILLGLLPLPRGRINETRDYSWGLRDCLAEGLRIIAKETYLLKDTASESWSEEGFCYLSHYLWRLNGRQLLRTAPTSKDLTGDW